MLGGRTISRGVIKAVGLSHEEYGHQEAKRTSSARQYTAGEKVA